MLSASRGQSSRKGPLLRALSIRQPYAEQILRGTKRIEYRTVPTNLRDRVYIYASLQAGDLRGFAQLGKLPGELPTGVLVGTVRIVNCTGRPGDYRWHLADPRRLARPRKPSMHPQPVFFYPFGRD